MLWNRVLDVVTKRIFYSFRLFADNICNIVRIFFAKMFVEIEKDRRYFTRFIQELSNILLQLFDMHCALFAYDRDFVFESCKEFANIGWTMYDEASATGRVPPILGLLMKLK